MFSLGSETVIADGVEDTPQQMWLQLLGAEPCLYCSPCCHTWADAGAESCLLVFK